MDDKFIHDRIGIFTLLSAYDYTHTVQGRSFDLFINEERNSMIVIEFFDIIRFCVFHIDHRVKNISGFIVVKDYVDFQKRINDYL